MRGASIRPSRISPDPYLGETRHRKFHLPPALREVDPITIHPQAAVGNKKCSRRKTMMIGCIDYFVDLLSMKVMKANVSGYFDCFGAVV